MDYVYDDIEFYIYVSYVGNHLGHLTELITFTKADCPTESITLTLENVDPPTDWRYEINN